MACLPCWLLGLKSRRVPATNEVVVANAEAGDPGEHEIVKHEGSGGNVTRKYGWDDIERMTMNFSRLIGWGGFSRVYLAHLPGYDTLAAIKVHNGPIRLFKQELNIQRCLDHENIVKLLGYSTNDRQEEEAEEEEEEEGCLLFEYVPNGSLQDRLHVHGDQSNSRQYSSVLSWKRRMAIAFQLAQALEYLHEKCALPIVHGDIKASNILLDEHLNCKLCDFGFAKTGFASTVKPSSPPPRRTKQLVMMGSPGYTDPHFLRTGIPSKRNDVYSYGVVVLELVTGMEAFCEERGQQQLLASLMGPTLSAVDRLEANEVAQVVDPRLQGGCGEGEVDLEEARAMLSISALCLGHRSALRPSAAQILRAIKANIHSISFLFSPEKQFTNRCHL